MNKRDFLKFAGMSSLTALSAGGVSVGCSRATHVESKFPETLKLASRTRKQEFNMTGFAAPRIDKIRIAYIGLGNRGTGAIRRIVNIANTEVVAVADIREDNAVSAQKFLESKGHSPEVYFGTEDSWKKAVEREDVDLVYICTPWALHAPMSIYAMEHGKHAASEIPAARSLSECWQLVETSERTRKHCIMLENVCYGFFELLTLNMAQQGFFGEVVHVEGAYIHDLYDSIFNKSSRHELWRLKENQRNANLYPMHGLGPVSQILGINRGDQYDYLTSMASNDFMVGKRAKELAKTDSDFKQYENATFRGNMSTTSIRTKKGKTIMLQHDITSPRPYSRIHLVSGTDGCAIQYPEPARIAKGHEFLKEEEYKALEKQFEPPIVRRIGELAKKVGGHGGMDFMMDWRIIDCLRNGLPMDMDVYDAAAWSSIIPLSEWSIANRSSPIDIPDFTDGHWQENKPVDMSISRGGNTEIILK